MNGKKRFNVKDALALIPASDQSDVLDFSDDEESDVVSEANDIWEEASDKDSDTEEVNGGEGQENAFESSLKMSM